MKFYAHIFLATQLQTVNTKCIAQLAHTYKVIKTCLFSKNTDTHAACIKGKKSAEKVCVE